MRGDPSASAGGIYIDDISLAETRCPNAVWRIQNFSKIMESADSNTVIDSPRFYSPEGYAYGVRVIPLTTYTDYTGSYTGLYFHLASGDNDAVLQWPAVNRQATLVVMDQDPDIRLRMSTARSFTTDMRKGKYFMTRAGHYNDKCNFNRRYNKHDPHQNFYRHFYFCSNVLFNSKMLFIHSWPDQYCVLQGWAIHFFPRGYMRNLNCFGWLNNQ